MNWWRSNTSLEHITPPGERWGESFDVLTTLRERMPTGDVLDFGCGDGRLVPAFASYRYTGVDINPTAITHCRALFPFHHFELIDESSTLPRSDIALAYTVLLHLDDREVALAADRLAACAHRVVVVEIMDRKWRRRGTPSTFNRSVDEYASLFSARGMHTVYVSSYPYPRYGKDAHINWLEFAHIGYGLVRNAS